MKRVPNDGVSDPVPDLVITPDRIVECQTVAIRDISAPVGDEATYFFFHNFVSGDPRSRDFLNAYSHVLPVLYRQDSSFGVVPKIIEAIGLASISNLKRSPDLMIAAGRKYATVLRTINASIQDPKEASTDQTLIAVILLGMFEVFQAMMMKFMSRILTSM